MNQQQLDQKRDWIKGKYIVGIDPAREKHQATIIDSNGNLVGKSFSFRHDANGFHNRLWFKLNQYLDPDLVNPEHLVFAVEASIDFWQALVDFLHRQHYTVVIVSPLTTKNSINPEIKMATNTSKSSSLMPPSTRTSISLSSRNSINQNCVKYQNSSPAISWPKRSPESFITFSLKRKTSMAVLKVFNYQK